MQSWFLQAMSEHCVPANRISEALLESAILFTGQNNQDESQQSKV